MKIDQDTVAVLKNFAKINPSILFERGNILRTLAFSKKTYGEAKVTTIFDKQFAIYNLDRFIATFSLFNDPEFIIHDSYVEISDNSRTVKYMCCDEESILKPPIVDPNKFKAQLSFDLTYSDYKNVEKAIGILGLPNFVINGDGENISIQAINVTNPSSDNYSINVGKSDRVFNIVFRPEDIKILPLDYTVTIYNNKMCNFKTDNVQYWIGPEKSSTI